MSVLRTPPSPADALLLTAALRSDAAGLQAWETWTHRQALDEVDSGQHGLVPLLHRNLSRAGVEHPDLARMRGIHRYWWSRNQLQLRRLTEVVQALGRDGIETLLLGDVAIMLQYYEDVGLRPLARLDILVHPEEAARAVRQLRERGWGLGEGGWHCRPDGSVDTDAGNGVILVADGEPSCGLFWHLLPECCWDDADQPVWRRSTERSYNGTWFRVPSATDTLFHVCVNRAADGGVPAILWLADVAKILENGRDGIDWDLLVGLARRRQLVLRLREALESFQQIVGLGLPEAARRRLRTLQPTAWERIEARPEGAGGAAVHEAARRLCRLSRRYADLGWPGQVAKLAAVVREIWAVKRRWRLPGMIGREVVPAYLRERAAHRRESHG